MSIWITEQITLVSGGHAHYYDTPTMYQILCWALHTYFNHKGSVIHVFPPFYKWEN